jgi:asparagine synthase (glutamine-hydrolysing)
MCGIAGILYSSENILVELESIQRMTSSLAHRGPDGEGVWRDKNIALGHRRLAIIDTSDAGLQPMHSSCSRYVITFNGEIYNYKELRSQLEEHDFQFQSHSDTEVLLNGYAFWGADLLSKLNGMFAFVIWDKQEKSLFVARDRLGIKPLFYSFTKDFFIFASEVKSILKCKEVSREIDPYALDDFFTYSYVAAPRTGYASIKQLMPGHFAKVKSGQINISCFWTVEEESARFAGDFSKAVSSFEETFENAVESHMVSDVPIGSFLSGGLDSAAVTYAMKKHGDVTAYTASFSDQDFDESSVASKVAGYIGVKHIIDDASLSPRSFIEDLVNHLDEPFADSSSLAVYQICKAARQHVKVVLSGDGADELLGGYTTYKASIIAQYYRYIPGAIRQGLLSPLLDNFPAIVQKRNSQNLLRRFNYASNLGQGRDHAAWRVIFQETEKDTLLTEAFRRKSKRQDPFEYYSHEVLKHTKESDYLQALMKADLKFYLLNDMLVKMDRMSMAHGLEVRVPFLDHRLVSLCLSLPSNFKIGRLFETKRVLRQYLTDKIPEIVRKRPKTGFNVPLARWMKEDLQPVFSELLEANRNKLAEYFNLPFLEKFWQEHLQGRKDHCHELFTLLVFFYWVDRQN